MTVRRTTRFVAAALSATVALLYLVLLFLVADAEAGARSLEGDTYGAYLFLAVPYLAGAVLLLVYDHRVLWAVGAAVQVAVLVLFVMFGAGAFGPGQGVFDYAALSDLPMGLWATVITGAEVVLLGLLVYLAAWSRPAGPTHSA
jgi:hypothetical protein